MKTIKAWHFLSTDYRLGYADGRKVGADTLTTVSGEPRLCKHGLHGSRKVLDALSYAHGPIVCRVTIGGKIIDGNNKIVGTERYIEWTLDATWLLHEFACWCAERALKKAGVSDERCWNAIFAKRGWLNEEVTDDELVAAWDAAWVAAWAAARAAAWDAARAAARAAAWDVAWDAAWDAACAAAWAAARAAAWDAAWDAAWVAAWNAAWDAQNRKFTRMLMEAV